MMTISKTLTRSLAVLIVAGSFAAAVPAFAQGTDALSARIADLHQKLQITPDQETKWHAVAAVMRHNAEDSRTMVLAKRQGEETMTAVADLQAYADLAEAHAKHVRKLAHVFEELYNSMSDDQKKVADQVFRDHKQKAAADQPPTQAQ